MGELFVLDTEADGLLNEITKFHCFVFSNLSKTKWRIFVDKEALPDFFIDMVEADLGVENIEWIPLNRVAFAEWLHSGEVNALVCHNLFGYDIPAWEMLGYVTGFDLDPDMLDGINIKLYDTLAMSRVLHPDRRLPAGCPAKMFNVVTGKMDTVGAHGLAAWGYRVSNAKPKVDDWRNQPLDVYVNRCIEDVKINIPVWQMLLKEAEDTALGAKNGWWDALPLAMENFAYMCLQERTGVPFDRVKAEKLVIRIDGMMLKVANDVEPKLPERTLPDSKQPHYPKEPFSDSGELSHHGWNWVRKLGYELNEEAFNKIKVPAKPFKQDGTLSAIGEKYKIEHELDDTQAVRESLALAKKQNDIAPLGPEQLEVALADVRSKRVPVLMETMTLGHQVDIKKWLYTVGGWRPTIWGTKNVTVGTNKVVFTNEEVTEKIKKYIKTTKAAVWAKDVYTEMGINFENFSEDKLVDKLKRKARYLITSPKFKDERGDLCEHLEMLKGDLVGQIVKWLSLRNRRGTLRALDEKKSTGWLNHPRLDVDGRLPARASGLANTTRQKHAMVVNVPKASPKVLLGQEMRELFYAPEDKVFLGWDGAALEQRVACWYCWKYDDGWYFHESMAEGTDFHEKMAHVYQEYAPDVTRDSGKNVTYGILYGCQAGKLSDMLGISFDDAQRIIDGFWSTNWSLKKLKENLEHYWERTGKKYIRGIDGRKIFTRSKHSLMNCLFQSTGAVTMDLAHSIMRKKIRGEGLQAIEERILYMHDEYQHLVDKSSIEWKVFNTEDEAKEFEDGRIWSNTKKLDSGKYCRYYSRIGEIASQSIEAAGEQLGAPLPITASYDVGRNWAETH